MRWLKPLFHLALLTALLVAALFSNYLDSTLVGPSFLRVFAMEVQVACHDMDTQWMVVLCICVYLITCLILERQWNPDLQGWCSSSANLGLGVLAALALAHYALAYQSASSSTQLLVLLSGMTLCKVASVGARFLGDKEVLARRIGWMIRIIVLLLAIGACWKPEMVRAFNYRRQIRWSGPWNDPNSYGLLVGLGVVLAGGQLVQNLKLKVCSHAKERGEGSVRVWWWLNIIFLLVAALATLVGLLMSYSRGAWLAVLCGFSYLGSQAVRNSLFKQMRAAPSIQRKGVSLFVVMCAVALMAFWQFRYTDRAIARRAFSIGNINDLSWRNRVVAWEGLFQMMVDKPWFGFGWNQPRLIYDNYYRPHKLAEGAAVATNDYLMLGATLGLPALFCFIAYIWFSVGCAERRVQLRECVGKKCEIRAPKSELPEPDHLKINCRAGVIMLLVGFWFDGGLFNLATAAPFWILLALQRRDSSEQD